MASMSRWVRTLSRTFALALASLALAGPVRAQVVNSPPAAPIAINVFPVTDFVSGTGYAATDRVIVTVIHPDGVTWGTDPANPLAPINGAVEVNHPGAPCWFGTTPDIRYGDRVRFSVVAGPNAGRVDEAFVGNVTIRRPVSPRPGTILVHGTTQDVNGAALPLGSLDVILKTTTDLFATGRTLKAPGDGTLVYDAPGALTWTATFTGLSAADVATALSADAGIAWLGRDGAGSEVTTYEVGVGVVGGPQSPCRTAYEILPPPPGFEAEPPTIPTALAATVTNANRVTLSWTAATDNVGVTSYGLYRDGIALTNVSRPDGLPPAPTTVVDLNVPAGTHIYTVDAADSVGNRSAQSLPITVVTQLGPPPAIAVNEPPVAPIDITAFPARDLVVSAGYLATDRVDIQLIRDGLLVASASDLAPVAGMVEVNHVGAYCWEGVTPEIRANDIIRTVARHPNGLIRVANQARVSGMTTGFPVVVRPDDPATPAPDGILEVRGLGIGVDGQPIPIDQMAVRIFALRWQFESARHWIRAESVPGAEGLIAYDSVDNPLGVKWTATFPNRSADDLIAIMGGTLSTGVAIEPAAIEARWLGRVPAALTEMTITEVAIADPPGPSPGACFTSFEPADTLAPSQPGLLTAVHAGLDSVLVSWIGSTDDWSLSHHLLLRDGQPYKHLPAAATSFLDAGVPPGLHTYQVIAFDHASPRGAGFDQSERLQAGWGQAYGNASVPSAIASYNQFDAIRPSTPLNLTGVSALGSISISWSPSTDNVGVAGYRVYRDGAAHADLAATDTTYTDLALTLGSHVYAVDAVDVAGNRSAPSAPLTMRNLLAPDNVPPTVPGAFTATVSPDAHGRAAVLAWTASTDNIGVAGYGVYRNGARIAVVNDLTLSYRDSLLATGTHQYRVDAYDSGGNRSALSAAIAVVIANSPPTLGRSIQVSPARDMVTVTGYPAIEGPFTIQVVRAGAVVGTATGTTDAAGRLDVNLVTTGRACWTTSTPDIRWDDIVRITNAAGIAEQTQVARLLVTRVIAIDSTSVMVKGTAQDLLGAPLPVDQLECRIAANNGTFVKNGVRTLRGGLGGDGTLDYDAPGSNNWTARFTGLSLADMNLIFGGVVAGRTVRPADVSGIWMGRQPLAGREASVFEVGAAAIGGPATPTCSAPRQLPAAISGVTPASLVFAQTAALPPTVSTAQRVTLLNSGNAPLTVRSLHFAGWHPNDWTIVAGTFPAVVPAGGRFTVDVAFAPKALGARSAMLCIATDAVNAPDHAIALAGTGFDGTLAGVPGAISYSLVGAPALTLDSLNVLANHRIPVTLRWVASVGMLASYQVQISTNGSVYTDAPVQPGNVPSLTLPLAMGTAAAPRSYQVRVRGLNPNGVPSAWAVGAAFRLVPYDEANAAQRYVGTFTTSPLAGSYGGTVRSAALAAARMDLGNTTTSTIPGSFAWITTMGPDRGRASVSIDRGAAVTVDLYSPTARTVMLPFVANLTAGRSHAVAITVLGTRNPLSTGNRVDFDGVVILTSSTVTAAPTPVVLGGPAASGPSEDELAPTLIPATLEFAPIQPNPSRGPAMLAFGLPRDGDVELGIVDIQGRQVRTVHRGSLAAGPHRITWDGRNTGGSLASPGVYFAVLRFEERVLTKRIIRLP